MSMILHRIIRKEIFTENFRHLSQDNELVFPDSGIVVIYGPNGIGKSSLACVFANQPETEFSLDFDGRNYTSAEAKSLFHVINDQNGRDIIQGSTEDFILGDNIRREYELKKAIEDGFSSLYNSMLIPTLKSDFGISKKESLLFDFVKDKTLVVYISDLANSHSKGKKIDRREFLTYIESMKLEEIDDYDENKLRFMINDFNSNKSIIKQLIKIVNKKLKIDPAFTKVEEHIDAITLLTKYYYRHECVVCDNTIERTALLERKRVDKDIFFNKLDGETREILDQIDKTLRDTDPFIIKQAITESAISGTLEKVIALVSEFEKYFKVFNQKINNLFSKCLDGSNLASNQQEYDAIVSEKPILTDEDVLFIERFVNDCIDRKIELQRDPEGNLELLLGQKKFLNENRNKLSLSNGEQNFISIAFELLKAKKDDAKVIILDDPISSFDSIYKNKIVYAIMKFLNKKKQILLTHNTDLITLLEHQQSQSFNLYILNNTTGERNGFIYISRDEQSLLLYLSKLVDFFRDNVKNFIKDKGKYLLAMVPFMRSFSQIMNKPQIKVDLTGIMHGYGNSKVDLAAIYNDLFNCSFISKPYVVSIDDILAINLEHWEIIDSTKFPLLNRSFVHILTYLFLRLKVEKKLIEKYAINTNQCDMLTRIIGKAFKEDSFENAQKRVFLLSRKTLLNEFNHYEQNLNIFQPAMDITDTALQKEQEDILQFLDSL
jgi:ABC-type lipoprotein export system ATPase subunit